MTSNDNDRDEELLARYRQAGKTDAVVPSDAVRAAILAESRRVAGQLAQRPLQNTIDTSRPAANDSRWKFTLFGTAGAALLAVLLFVPRYWENAPPAAVSNSPEPASVAAEAQAPKLAEVKPNAELPKAADAWRSPQFAAPAASPPLSVAQNYAPVSPSASPFTAARPAPAARIRMPDLSGQSAENRATAGVAARADGVQKAMTLQSAIAQGDVAQAATLLDQGAVIDARDEAGRTPLMLAVTQDKLELVRLLLARGADPNAADNGGHTPLQQATKRNLQDIASLLEQAGAH